MLRTVDMTVTLRGLDIQLHPSLPPLEGYVMGDVLYLDQTAYDLIERGRAFDEVLADHKFYFLPAMGGLITWESRDAVPFSQDRPSTPTTTGL